ncbi:SET domain-containing protein [Kaistella palustris]|uniref:SET domain-containing protein n=1 Tax=Kaistella palustris TaxID=493376 RepID=UPI00040EB11B|nr:SET domain-containing protein-lysine N-methyltransferase [Kaistella palustris]
MKNSKKFIDRDFILVKSSPIHGKGVFAKKAIPKGTRIIEYMGKRILKEDLPSDREKGLTSLVYVMRLDDLTAIDGEREGNDARFFNHSCMPNCEVYFFDQIPYIYAMEDIIEGAELFFDYQLGSSSEQILSLAEKIKLHPCHCGAANCRKTLIQ